MESSTLFYAFKLFLKSTLVILQKYHKQVFFTNCLFTLIQEKSLGTAKIMNHDDLSRKKCFHYNFSIWLNTHIQETQCADLTPLGVKTLALSAVSTPAPPSCSQPHRRAVPSSSRPVQSGAVCVQLQSLLQQQARRSARRAREGKKLPSFFSEPLHPRGAASFFR